MTRTWIHPVPVVALAILIVVSLSLMPRFDPVHADETGGTLSIPVPSAWSGLIEGAVGGVRFRLPVEIELARPLQEEANPLHLSIGAGDEGQVGNLLLRSAQDYATPYTGRTVTLQYLTLRATPERGIRGVLTNDQSQAAAVLNAFTGPNTSVDSAPPVMREIQASLGPTEIYAFREGAVVVIKSDGSELVGTVIGNGHGMVNIFPSPDVEYRATFRARKHR
jgi:hypothetical protein